MLREIVDKQRVQNLLVVEFRRPVHDARIERILQCGRVVLDTLVRIE